MQKLPSLFLLMILILLGFNNNALVAKPENNSTFKVKIQDQKEAKGQTYIIIDKGSVTDIQPYIDALNNSDMSNHRLLNKRYTVVFKTGVKVELFSASELSKSGRLIILSDYLENFDASRQEPIFALGANNFIIEYHTSSAKHH
ncbi:MAG: hypothetical protein Q8L90_18990 [Bacteroidota bacterium]|nr:hypothetical protein [Bacteroidota bacterium]